jgi:uncharacterized integral membrane protein
LRTLNYVLAVVFALVVILFAVSNLDPVDVRLWPFPVEVTTRLYAVVLVAVLIGFLCGMIASWLVGGTHRRDRRRLRGRVKELEDSLRRQDLGPPLP